LNSGVNARRFLRASRFAIEHSWRIFAPLGCPRKRGKIIFVSKGILDAIEAGHGANIQAALTGHASGDSGEDAAETQCALIHCARTAYTDIAVSAWALGSEPFWVVTEEGFVPPQTIILFPSESLSVQHDARIDEAAKHADVHGYLSSDANVRMRALERDFPECVGRVISRWEHVLPWSTDRRESYIEQIVTRHQRQRDGLH
jgi:hypothetical protein